MFEEVLSNSTKANILKIYNYLVQLFGNYTYSAENRQKILLVLMDNCVGGGVRVDNIAKRVNLSRAAVSHHLKLLAEIDNSIDGTEIYFVRRQLENHKQRQK